MAEPEEVLIHAARHATGAVARLWQRRDRAAPEKTALAAQRQRLELLVAAVFGVPLPIRTAQPPAPPTALSRLLGRRTRHLRPTGALPGHDGAHVYLPRELPGGDDALALYKAIALQQAGRALRRPAGPCEGDDRLTGELALICEAATVDLQLARELPGTAVALCAVRASALRERPALHGLEAAERAVEALYRRLLESPPGELPAPFRPAAGPADSLRWARGIAAGLREPARYRGTAKDMWLGLVLRPVPGSSETLRGAQEEQPARARPASARLARRPEVREKKEGEDDRGPGMWMLQMDDPEEHAEDPMGMQRPADRDADAPPGELADSLSELPEARLVSTPRPAPEVLLGDDPLPRRSQLRPAARDASGIVYPEWDWRAAAYDARGAVVRLAAPCEGDPAWAPRVLARRRGLVDAVRRRFEGLRPRRRSFDRQLDGDELDVAAYVASHAEALAGHPPDGRLYRAVRPARRDMAIVLLIDVSGSTDAWVSQDRRIIDVEKEALLIVCHALDALGDPHAVLAFSGEGQANVSVTPLKGFDERIGPTVGARIAALEAERYTRTGAALRHAAAQLAGRDAAHRLLLLLSDGKPNDADHYDGRYGVEDMRQAVAEAVLQGIHPFCATVDRHAPSYLPGIFGPGRYAVLQHPERLPVLLVELLRRLVGRASH